MLRTLSTQTFDPLGHVQLQVLPDTTDGETRRRVNRIATLDGGAVLNDSGYSDADRTIEFTWANSSAIVHAAIDRLVQLYSQVVCCTQSGVYLVALESYTPGADESTLRMLVTQKLSA